MDRADILDRIAEQLVARDKHPRGMLGIMEDSEVASGYRLVPLGSALPFPVPREDFDAALISLDGKDARIVIVTATHKRAGAFSRLVNGIQSAGYRPCVIEPVGDDMPAIMRKWKWRGRRRNGLGWDSWLEYRPRSSIPTRT